MNCADCNKRRQSKEKQWSDFGDDGYWCESRDINSFIDKDFPYEQIPQSCIDNKLFEEKPNEE
jgi:hypothetical protein